MNTLLFSEQLDVFMSITSDNPEHFIRVAGVEYFIDQNNAIRRFNTGYANSVRRTMVKFVVNDSFENTKIFDNTELFFEPFNSKSITSANFSTSRQNSGNVDGSMFDIREETYRLAIPRNLNSNTYPERMRDKYMISTYVMDLGLNNIKFYTLPYVKTRFRYSFI